MGEVKVHVIYLESFGGAGASPDNDGRKELLMGGSDRILYCYELPYPGSRSPKTTSMLFTFLSTAPLLLLLLISHTHYRT